jgi:hypothetical protein
MGLFFLKTNFATHAPMSTAEDETVYSHQNAH